MKLTKVGLYVIPCRVVVSCILVFVDCRLPESLTDFEGIKEFIDDVKNFYGYFKSDKFKKLFFLWKSFKIEDVGIEQNLGEIVFPYKEVQNLYLLKKSFFEVNDLKKLERLYLGVHKISLEFIKDPSVLRYLTISMGCKIDVSVFTNLRRLELEFCEVVKFPSEVEQLKLEWCDFSSIPEIKNLKKLTLQSYHHHREVLDISHLSTIEHLVLLSFFGEIDISKLVKLKFFTMYGGDRMLKFPLNFSENVERLRVHSIFDIVQQFYDNLYTYVNLKRVVLKTIKYENGSLIEVDVHEFNEFERLENIEFCGINGFNLSLPKLRILKLSFSYVDCNVLSQNFDEGLRNVRILHLDNCPEVEIVTLTNLEKLSAKRCIKLAKIESWNLEKLTIGGVRCLEDISHLKKLKEFEILKNTVYFIPKLPLNFERIQDDKQRIVFKQNVLQ